MSARSLMELTRREMLTVMASAGVATFVGVESTTEGEAMADSMTTPPAYRGSHEPKPLPFDPSKLRGLSEKLLRSHHENNLARCRRTRRRIRPAHSSARS